jgi:hypothetical protein
VVSGKSESAKLIVQKLSVRPVSHAVHIFDNERPGQYVSENSVKLAVKKINRLVGVASTALAVALAWIATRKKVRRREPREIANVAFMHVWVRNIVAVRLAGNVPDIIGPDHIEARPLECVIRTPAAAK